MSGDGPEEEHQVDDATWPDVTPGLDDLAEQLGGGSGAAEVVALYLDELPGRLGRIAGADLEEAARGAHSLKSASGLVGLMDLSAACGTLEAALRDDPATARPDLVAEVTARAPGGEAALRRWLAGREA